MPWSATAEVAEFDEALDYFKKRLPITTAKLAEMGDRARDRAFWITGVAQLDVVAQVHKSIIDALKNGTPFEEWQKEIGPKLTEAWGQKNAWRCEVIYRNATQQAYIAGRMAQLRDPAVLALRPFWKYIAIDDGRCPTGVCPQCNGVTLPPDHPWWATHSPQMHHACRCRVDSMTRETVKEQGGTSANPTDVVPPEGWGSPPDLQTTEEWKQPVDKRIREKVHPELVNEFDRKQVADKPKAPSKPKTNPDHDPKRWEPYYREKGYDDSSARALAHGRAMQERGLDMKPNSFVAALKPFADLQEHSGLFRDAVRRVEFITTQWPSTKSVRAAIERRPDLKLTLEAAASFAAQAEALGKDRMDASFTVSKDIGPASLEGAKRAAAFYAVFAAKSYSFKSVDVEFDSPNAVDVGNRGYYDGTGRWHAQGKANWISADKHHSPDNMVTHELGHCLEFNNERAKTRARSFLKARTAGEEPRKLSELLGGAYEDWEVTRKDKFVDPYMGKEYAEATEVTSIAAEYAINSGALLLRRDPDTFHWLLGQLADVD